MMDLKALRKTFLNGIFNENPTFRLVLGMCPTLAITYQAFNGIGMGLATTFVLVFSNLVISLLRNLIPEKIRIPAFIVIIATFVTVVEMVMHAFLPDLYDRPLFLFLGKNFHKFLLLNDFAISITHFEKNMNAGQKFCS